MTELPLTLNIKCPWHVYDKSDETFKSERALSLHLRTEHENWHVSDRLAEILFKLVKELQRLEHEEIVEKAVPLSVIDQKIKEVENWGDVNTFSEKAEQKRMLWELRGLKKEAKPSSSYAERIQSLKMIEGHEYYK